MAGKRLYTWQEGSERYWLQRARQADKAAGRTVAAYDRFESARTGWRLLAFTFLAWEVLGRDPVIRQGNPFRLNGGYRERWDFGQAQISRSDLDAIGERPPVLGSLVVSPAGIMDTGLREALLQTGRGAEIPELGDGAKLSHVCATATHFYNRTGTYHALILPHDGPPIEVDPQEIVPEPCAELAQAYAALQTAMKRPQLDWTELEGWAARIQHLTAAIRAAVWAAHNTGTVPAATGAAPDLMPAPSHEVLLHLLASISPLATWEQTDAGLQHVSGHSTLAVGPATGDPGAVVAALSDETLLVLLIALARWCDESLATDFRPRPVALSVAAILDRRGIAKHKNGGYKTGDKRRIADHLQTLGKVLVAVHTPWSRSAGTDPSPLLTVQPAPSGKAYDFLIAPGDWIGNRAATRQLGYWFAALAALDRRQDGAAMRLGLYLSLQYRVRAGYRNLTQPWKVATLVSATQPATGLHPGTLDRRNPKRLRRQLEQALDRLQSLGVVSSWEYAGDEPLDEGKGWLEDWLTAKIVVRPPQLLQDRYQAVVVSRQNAALPSQPHQVDAAARWQVRAQHGS